MTCEAFDALLDKLLDGETTQAEAQAMNDHAAQCPGCAKRLQTARLLAQDLSRLAESDTTEEAYAAFQKGWRAQVASAAKKSKPRAAAKPRRLNAAARAALSMAAALVFLVGGTLLTRGRWTNVLTSPEKAEQSIMLTSLDAAPATAGGTADDAQSDADATDAAANTPMTARFARSAEAPAQTDAAKAPDMAEANAEPAPDQAAPADQKADNAPSFWADMAAFLVHALPWLAGLGAAALLVLIGAKLYLLKEKRRKQ